MNIKAQTTRGSSIRWVFLRKGKTFQGFMAEKAGFYRVEETGEVTYLGHGIRDWQADIRDYRANGWDIATR